MTAPLRVATVGTGYFSQFQYAAWKRMSDVELVAICNRTVAKAVDFAKRFEIPATFGDFGRMLDEARPDVVDVITPPETHLDCIREAAARGIPVICQKPFTPDLATARHAVEIAEQGGALLVIHENYRFQPWHREARRLIAEGALGQVYAVTFRMRTGDGQGPEAYLKRQPYFQKMPRLLIHETGIHFIDTFRSLLGEVSSVYAELRKLNPVIAGEDAGYVLFDFANGARGLFDGNRLADHRTANTRLTFGEMLIEGSEAVLTLDGFGNLVLRRQGEREGRAVAYEWQDIDFCGDCVYLFQRHVVDHMLYGRPLVNTGREYLRNLEIEEAVYESSATCKRIEVPAT